MQKAGDGLPAHCGPATTLAVARQLLLGVSMATFLHRETRAVPLLRAISLLPMAITPVAATFTSHMSSAIGTPRPAPTCRRLKTSSTPTTTASSTRGVRCRRRTRPGQLPQAIEPRPDCPGRPDSRVESARSKRHRHFAPTGCLVQAPRNSDPEMIRAATEAEVAADEHGRLLWTSDVDHSGNSEATNSANDLKRLRSADFWLGDLDPKPIRRTEKPKQKHRSALRRPGDFVAGTCSKALLRFSQNVASTKPSTTPSIGSQISAKEGGAITTVPA